MEAFTAIYTNREIIVPTQSEADSLLQDGYGYRKNHTHLLRGVETLYNVERGKIHVIDEDSNHVIGFQELLRLLTHEDPELWIKFIVYKDLRQRGFIIKIDQGFKVYERGDYGKTSASYQLKIISEGKPEQLKQLVEELEHIEKQGLEMKIAVVDRRGEIVYYSLEEKNL